MPRWDEARRVLALAHSSAIRTSALVVALACGLVPLAACAEYAACNNAGFLAVQHAHASRAEVTLCGNVVGVRAPKRTRSGWHRYIFVDVGHNDRVEIDINLDETGNIPVRSGEAATIRGEYYYDQNGREGVHWTHHTDRGSHPAGFVILNGTLYD